MIKYKRIDVNKVVNYPYEIQIGEYNAKEYEFIYNAYLKRGYKLTYKNQDLLKYIKNLPKQYKTININGKDILISKKNYYAGYKRGIFAAALFFMLYILHVAGKDYKIHEEANAKNAYALIDELSIDTNNDDIPEIYTEVINYVDEYFKPSDDIYYNNSNPIYNSLEKTRVLDNVGYIIAMDHLNIGLIEIDGELYSKTGKVSEYSYTDTNNKTYIFKTHILDPETAQIEFTQKLNKLFGKVSNYNIKYVTTYDAKTLEEIPTIYKYKEDGHIEKKDSNRVLGKIANNYTKSN